MDKQTEQQLADLEAMRLAYREGAYNRSKAKLAETLGDAGLTRCKLHRKPSLIKRILRRR